MTDAACCAHVLARSLSDKVSAYKNRRRCPPPLVSLDTNLPGGRRPRLRSLALNISPRPFASAGGMLLAEATQQARAFIKNRSERYEIYRCKREGEASQHG